MLKGVAGASNFGKTIKDDLNIRFDDMKTKIKAGVDNVKSFGTTGSSLFRVSR